MDDFRADVARLIKAGNSDGWPGRLLRYPPVTRGADVRDWQQAAPYGSAASSTSTAPTVRARARRAARSSVARASMMTASSAVSPTPRPGSSR